MKQKLTLRRVLASAVAALAAAAAVWLLCRWVGYDLQLRIGNEPVYEIANDDYTQIIDVPEDGLWQAVPLEAGQTLYDAVTVMNRVVEEYKAKYGLNYSVLATPAEGLSGRFTRMDRKRYGEIPGVTDRDYYVNSFHVDVREPVSIVEKIRLEAPFHAITRGGHITYVELDGEARKNPVAILKIVKVMQDEGIGYGSINHPIDTCRKCGHRGVIYSKCPVCGSDDILRMRRITGYLTGSLESWNSAKQAEERDRVKHR